jgi:hypothetical protein
MGTSFQQVNNGDTSFAYRQNRKLTRSGTSHNLIMGLDYFLDAQNTLTGSFLYSPSNGVNKSSITYDDLDKFGKLQQTVLRNERENEREKEMEASLSYRRKFKQKDQLLTADFKYVWGDEVELTDYRQGAPGAGTALLQRADTGPTNIRFFFKPITFILLAKKQSWKLASEAVHEPLKTTTCWNSKTVLRTG